MQVDTVYLSGPDPARQFKRDQARIALVREAADVHGYSRLMGQDEEATLRTLTSHPG
jgi:hypothetical protein